MKVTTKYRTVILLTIVVMIASTFVIAGGIYMLLKSMNIITEIDVFGMAISFYEYLFFQDALFTFMMCIGFYHTYTKIENHDYTYVRSQLKGYKNELLWALGILVLAIIAGPFYPVAYIFAVLVAIIIVTGYAYVFMVSYIIK